MGCESHLYVICELKLDWQASFQHPSPRWLRNEKQCMACEKRLAVSCLTGWSSQKTEALSQILGVSCLNSLLGSTGQGLSVQVIYIHSPTRLLWPEPRQSGHCSIAWLSPSGITLAEPSLFCSSLLCLLRSRDRGQKAMSQSSHQPPLGLHVSVQIQGDIITYIPSSQLLKSGYRGGVCSHWISVSLALPLPSPSPSLHVGSRNTPYGPLHLTDQCWPGAVSQQMAISCLHSSCEPGNPLGHMSDTVSVMGRTEPRHPDSKGQVRAAWSSPQAQVD